MPPAAIGRLSQTDDFYGTPGYTNRFGYRGYWFEPELGLYFVRHRVLDPRFGKWLTRDPIGYAGGWNLYRYVNGRPFRFYDPFGLDWFDFVVSLGAGIGDALTFGLTDTIRESTGLNDVVDKGGTGYAVGMGTGAVGVGVLTGGVGGSASLALAGSRSYPALIAAGGLGGILGDAAAQGTLIANGQQATYNPMQTFWSGALGGLLGAASKPFFEKLYVLAGGVDDVGRAGATGESAKRIQLARVIGGPPRQYPKIGLPDDELVFVTDAAAIRSAQTADELAELLSIPNRPVFTVYEFPPGWIPKGLQSPIVQPRGYPNWIPGGKTRGGAPEYRIPNQKFPPGTIPRVVPSKAAQPGETACP